MRTVLATAHEGIHNLARPIEIFMTPTSPLPFEDRKPDLQLDLEEATVVLAGQVIRLRPKAFAVLCQLATSGGRLVHKHQLLDAVWQGVAVSDGAIKVCVREIRKALGDNPKCPRFIQTVPCRGYRFVGRAHLGSASSTSSSGTVRVREYGGGIDWSPMTYSSPGSGATELDSFFGPAPD